MPRNERKQACQYAQRLLARREHTRLELTRKLAQKKYSPHVIEAVLDYCIGQGWQDDQRFARAYFRVRSDKGYGLLRIKKELEEKGVSSEDITSALSETDIDWVSLLQALKVKKFSQVEQDDYEAQAKQKRFFYYRGFSTEEISRVMG